MNVASRERILVLDRQQLFRFWKNVRKSRGCWEWTASTADGYGQFRLGKKMVKTHQISFFLTNGYLPEMVTHTCHNRKCCNPKHLKPGNAFTNRMDAIRSGRASFGCCKPGQANINRGVSYNKVKLARRLYKQGLRQTEIGRRLNMSPQTVNGIVTNRRRLLK